MSGFEIAGIVLGAFPLLCNASKGLSNRYKDLQTWWRFEREFEDFVADVWREYITFSQIIDILVEPLVNLTTQERETLQHDPQSELWRSLRVQAELQRRIPTKYYNWFMVQLTEINDEINALHQLLPIGKAYLLDSTSVESELYRLRTAFSHKKDVHMSKISEKNKTLYEFLDRASHLSRSSTPSPLSVRHSNRAVSSILELQEQARCLYKCFQSNWECSCSQTQSHPCNITVDGSNLKLLFDDQSRTAQLRLDFKQTRPEPPPTASPSKSEEVLVLSEQISRKARMRTFKDRGTKGILGLAASSISALSRTKSRDRSGFDGMQRHGEKLKKKSVAFANNGTITQDTATPTTNTTTLTTTDPASAVETSSNGKITTNICLAIRDCCQQQIPCHVYMNCSPDLNLIMNFDELYQGDAPRDNLEAFLSSTPRRKERLQLGLALVSTIVKLGPCWLPIAWSKKTVLIGSRQITSDKALTSYQPYLSHPSIHRTLKSEPEPATAKIARASLLTLGIILMELLFRETLEEQPFHAEFLSGGRANEFTELCAALRWQNKVEEEFGDKVANAIRLCVTCEFDSPNFESSRFVEVLWSSVVKPMEDFLQAYS